MRGYVHVETNTARLDGRSERFGARNCGLDEQGRQSGPHQTLYRGTGMLTNCDVVVLRHRVRIRAVNRIFGLVQIVQQTERAIRRSHRYVQPH